MTYTNTVPSNCCPEVEHSIGFCLLYRKQTLKLDFDAGGIPAMESVIAALIASGINTEEDILDEISDITGLHNEDRVRMVLMEGENLLWFKSDNGTFLPLSHQ
jgi:hypothetical protein